MKYAEIKTRLRSKKKPRKFFRFMKRLNKKQAKYGEFAMMHHINLPR